MMHKIFESKKFIFTMLILTLLGIMLSGCANLGDTVVKRGGDNTGFKDWAVEQTFKWGKQ